MSTASPFRIRFPILIAAFLLILPAIPFYTILFRRAINIPVEDDYEALLGFLNQAVEQKGFSAKISWFLTSQFNEYKPFFGHAIAWLQLILLGHVDIRMLCVVGDASVLLLAFLLWKMFIPAHKNLEDRLLFFIPISWALFQLQYVETLNWAMPSLQNLPVLLFAFGTIYLLLRPGLWLYIGALASMVLAVAASANGLLLVPIGLLILFADRRKDRMAGWLLVSVLCIAAYAYKYNILSSQSRLQESLLANVLRPQPLYVLAFMGSFASSPVIGHHPVWQISLSLILGIMMSVFFFILWKRGYHNREPVVSHCILFLLFTAIGVAGLRSDFGVVHSLDSRYAIYSILLTCLSWFAIAEEFLVRARKPSACKGFLWVTILGMMLLAFITDYRGWLFLTYRNRQTIAGMAAFQRPNSRLGPVLPRRGQGPRFDELDQRAPIILRDSIRLGIYRPPFSL
jgi:hypothetical protein